MDDKQLEEYEASFIDQFNCPLNFDFVMILLLRIKKGSQLEGTMYFTLIQPIGL